MPYLGLNILKRQLVRRLMLATLIAVPAGTAIALAGSGSSETTPNSTKNNNGSVFKLEVQRQNAQKLATPTDGENNTNETSTSVSQSGQSDVAGQRVSVSTSSTNARGDDATTKAEVNGRKIDIPANGEIHKVLNTAGGKTVLNISSSRNSTAGNSSSTSLNVNISSSSNSSGDR